MVYYLKMDNGQHKMLFSRRDTHMKTLKVGDRVYAEITGNKGIITVIHNGATKIMITEGRSPITDYYLKDLMLIK
ncbi:hypothetical protein D3C74_448820 [compost metagenome]